ncbi:MAG: DUF1566 domain-containing protein [Desulfocapsaceae bacterium]|nr:DUF1566 domain-containing protein [Desulfocapsaceae bacterium]
MACSTANAGEKSPIYLLLSGVRSPQPPYVPPYVRLVPLNDTGITWGGNYPSGNNSTCTGEEIGAQDCFHGRDATNYDNSDGYAGFSFTKLGNNGVALANQAVDYATMPWACVKDNVTGLTWEVKTNDGGLHDQNDIYTWYNTDPAANGGSSGEANSSFDTCEGYDSGNDATYCNTEAYVARVNAAGWCGKSDWRMPTLKELEGIVFFGTSPTIDLYYFPNTPASSLVWSGTPLAQLLPSGPNVAWGVDFNDGSSDGGFRSDYGRVRLVRGGQ